jgi:hypothetical protein
MAKSAPELKSRTPSHFANVSGTQSMQKQSHSQKPENSKLEI